MKILSADLDKIRPTQLFISEKKYRQCLTLFKERGFDKYEPLPIKKIGSDTFFTDGHTRALILWQNNKRKVKVYYDTDDMNWIMYLVDLQWCRDAGIHSIQDMQSRVVGEREYVKKWEDQCSEFHERLTASPIADLEIQFEKDGPQKAKICNDILWSLPEWFGIDQAIRDYTEAVKELLFVKATLYGKAVGFFAVKVNYRFNADLYVLGIYKEFHRNGIGARMVDFINTYCKSKSIPYMSVKTLSERHPTKIILRLAHFMKDAGFMHLKSSRPCGEKQTHVSIY